MCVSDPGLFLDWRGDKSRRVSDELPPGLPLGRGHELHIDLRQEARPPHRQPPRQNQKHTAFKAKWISRIVHDWDRWWPVECRVW